MHLLQNNKHKLISFLAGNLKRGIITNIHEIHVRVDFLLLILGIDLKTNIVS